MRSNKILLTSGFLLLILLSFHNSRAQKGVTAFGIQFKPILPLGIVNSTGINVTDPNTNYSLNVEEKGGYAFGAVIRFGLTKRFSLETGINYTKRNYDFNLTSPDVPSSKSQLGFTGYEIPITGMVWVQLGQKMYMNASGGFSFDFFPSGGLVNYDRDSIEYGMKEKNWIIYGLTANLGFEYRTEAMGFFYIGASYHQPMGNMADIYVNSREPNTNNFTLLVSPPPSVIGTYLTLDIRYFFNSGMKEKRR